jgi:hypothetical protein
MSTVLAQHLARGTGVVLAGLDPVSTGTGKPA